MLGCAISNDAFKVVTMTYDYLILILGYVLTVADLLMVWLLNSPTFTLSMLVSKFSFRSF